MTACPQYLNSGERHKKGDCIYCDKEHYMTTTELKTFQDLVLYEHLTERQRDEAKQEAIKWIKELREIMKNYEAFNSHELGKRFNKLFGRDTETIISDDYYSDEAIGWMVCFIEHFFNITDEDLK